ncbi:hypothetical protein [Caloranaerobacter azorensis]|uniref:hypothetical protein n=1 Tax=Caloranaerobacter azorensis TaxID=116090 RepID=UPI00068CAEE5|nr:hypothetical protein [Caloranaerobacter azorensis]
MYPWQEIMLNLKNDGFEVYPPGIKRGNCESPYVVVKDDIQSPIAGTNKIGYKIIDLIIFYPLNRYSEIENYKRQIKSSMDKLKFIRKTGNETPVIIDDDRKAYTTSIEYIVYKKIGG